MLRDVYFYAKELDGYVRLEVDIKVNIRPDKEVVQIEIPRMSKHCRVKEILIGKE